MSGGTTTYHDHPQLFRIQKRLVLNQCFKSIHPHWQAGTTINYVTFGGEHLYDVMDLVSVFDIRQQKLNVVSYEENEQVAVKSRACPVAATLSKVSTISVEIVPTVFFENARPLRELRPQGPMIYFLDDTRTFRDHQADNLAELLSAHLVRAGDWLLITSCLMPLVVQSSGFMSKYDGTFKLFYGPETNVTVDFRVRNHVDLLVARCFSGYRPPDPPAASKLCASLIRKFRYRDTKAPMGLWLYRIEELNGPPGNITDSAFEEFPLAFEYSRKEPDVPSIFDD